MYFLCVGVYGVVLIFVVYCRVSLVVFFVLGDLEYCLVFVCGEERLIGDFVCFDFDLVYFVKVCFCVYGVNYNFYLVCFGKVCLNRDCVYFDWVYLKMDGVCFDKFCLYYF